MKRLPRAYSRDKRKQQILMQFDVWYTNGDEEPKTMNRIARALGMIPAQKVTDMLLELVDEGKLGFIEREKSGRWTARAFYSNVKTLITEKYGKRRIVVKRRGVIADNLEVPSGQMGLFS
jgi:hypothetical protein